MKTVTLIAAQEDLPNLVEEAAAGEEIVISKAGKPIAKLVPVPAEQPVPAQKPRALGLLTGKVRLHDDFDDPLPDDLQALFEGR